MSRLTQIDREYMTVAISNAEVAKSICDAIDAGGSGGVGTGNPVSPSNANQILYVDGSNNLAQSFHLSFDGQYFNTMFDTVPNRTFGITTNPLIFGFFPGAAFNGSDPANGLQAVDGIFDGTGFVGSPVVNIRYNNNLHTNDQSFDIMTAGTIQHSAQTNTFNGGLTIDDSSGLILGGAAADSYTFTLSAPHNATAGAIYQSNSFSFVVMSSITGGMMLVTRNGGSSIPLSGTLTLYQGVGDNSISYSSFVQTTGLRSVFGIDTDGNIGWNAQGVAVRLPTSPGSIGQVLGITATPSFLQLGWISAGGGGGLALGNSITGGVANRILYSDASQTLRENDTLQFDGTHLDLTGKFYIHNSGTMTLFNNGDVGGVEFKVDNTMVSLNTYVLPVLHPVADSGYYLTSTSNGVMSWQTVSVSVPDASTVQSGIVNIDPAGQIMYGNKEFNYTTTSTSTNNLVSLLNVNFGSPSTGTQQTAFQATVELGDVVDHSSDIVTAVQGQVIWNGNNVNTINGLLTSINVGSDVQNINNIYGLQNNVINGTQGNTGTMAGTWSYVAYSAPSGTLFNMYGSVAVLQGGGASHINNVYAFHVYQVPTALQASNVFGFFDSTNSTSQFGQVNLMNTKQGNGGGLTFYSDSTVGGGNAVSFQLPSAITTSAAYTLPPALPQDVNSYLAADPTGTMYFVSPFRTIICGFTSGGSTTEIISAPGLTTSDTVCAISQTIAGANNTAVTGFTTITAGNITVQWTSDPGAGAQITLIVRNFADT